MARMIEDLKTADLLIDVAPIPKRRGRPPNGEKPMSAAERKRASRLNSNKVSIDIERPILESIQRQFPGIDINVALASLLANRRELARKVGDSALFLYNH